MARGGFPQRALPRTSDEQGFYSGAGFSGDSPDNGNGVTERLVVGPRHRSTPDLICG